MGDTGDTFRAFREERTRRRSINFSRADPTGWKKHTMYHWYRIINGKKLDYWPSSCKWQYEGKIMQGDVMQFIYKRLKNPLKE